ncbi:MAG: glycosyltransferase [Mediterranea sp.]|jgi:glycosyltransferase involved in cell wall biosynthesis|nr:glycosyltransferase [Mediterranea sp.]
MENQQPLVSVIIPVYNIEEYVGACLESVINQTYQELEIIVVNDGSIDGSADAIGAYMRRDNRIMCINKTNGGLPSARKSGVDKATGKYIQHLDGDDALMPDAIERLVACAEATGADLVAAPFYYQYPDGRLVNSKELSFDLLDSVDYFDEILKDRAYWSVWSNFQRRTLFVEHPVRFITTIDWGEDGLLMTQLILYARKVAAIHQPIYYYNQRVTSITGRMNYAKYQQYKAYMNWIEAYLRERGVYGRLAEGFARRWNAAVFEQLFFERYETVGKDLKRISMSLKTFPQLENALSIQQRKLMEYYRRFSWMVPLFLKLRGMAGRLRRAFRKR